MTQEELQAHIISADSLSTLSLYSDGASSSASVISNIQPTESGKAWFEIITNEQNFMSQFAHRYETYTMDKRSEIIEALKGRFPVIIKNAHEFATIFGLDLSLLSQDQRAEIFSEFQDKWQDIIKNARDFHAIFNVSLDKLSEDQRNIICHELTHKWRSKITNLEGVNLVFGLDCEQLSESNRRRIMTELAVGNSKIPFRWHELVTLFSLSREQLSEEQIRLILNKLDWSKAAFTLKDINPLFDLSIEQFPEHFRYQIIDSLLKISAPKKISIEQLQNFYNTMTMQQLSKRNREMLLKTVINQNSESIMNDNDELRRFLCLTTDQQLALPTLQTFFEKNQLHNLITNSDQLNELFLAFDQNQINVRKNIKNKIINQLITSWFSNDKALDIESFTKIFNYDSFRLNTEQVDIVLNGYKGRWSALIDKSNEKEALAQITQLKQEGKITEPQYAQIMEEINPKEIKVEAVPVEDLTIEEETKLEASGKGKEEEMQPQESDKAEKNRFESTSSQQILRGSQEGSDNSRNCNKKLSQVEVNRLIQQYSDLLQQVFSLRKELSSKEDPALMNIDGLINFLLLKEQFPSPTNGIFKIETNEFNANTPYTITRLPIQDMDEFNDFKNEYNKKLEETAKAMEKHRSIWNQFHPIFRAILGVLALIAVIPAIVAHNSNDGYKKTFFGTPSKDPAQKMDDIVQSARKVMQQEIPVKEDEDKPGRRNSQGGKSL